MALTRRHGLLLVLWLASCRQGAIAGRGALCQRDQDCRAGFSCVSGACRVVATDELDADIPVDVAAPVRLDAPPVHRGPEDAALPVVVADAAVGGLAGQGG